MVVHSHNDKCRMVAADDESLEDLVACSWTRLIFFVDEIDISEPWRRSPISQIFLMISS